MTKPFKLTVTKEWIERMAKLEEECGDITVIGAMPTAPMSERITIDPQVCAGQPCIRGLRIRVQDILALLAAGVSVPDILADYPLLEPADIVAVLQSTDDH